MKRWLASGFIVVYLSVLMFGLGSHTLSFGVSSHPAMYYIVWDMFCGWASYASKVHVVGEGESGKYYELAPGPWGGFCPWGDMDRANYDVYGTHCGRIAMNTLKHTKHEPISRIFVVEETWSKKYDLPASIWQARFDEPQKRKTYCRIIAEMCGEGNLLRSYQPWLSFQNNVAIASNPRLQEEAQRYRPMMLVESADRMRGRDLTLPIANPGSIAFGQSEESRGVGGMSVTVDGN